MLHFDIQFSKQDDPVVLVCILHLCHFLRPKKEASPVCEKKATQTKPNKREVKHDGETEAGEAKMLDNSSETKRPRLFDEHTS